MNQAKFSAPKAVANRKHRDYDCFFPLATSGLIIYLRQPVSTLANGMTHTFVAREWNQFVVLFQFSFVLYSVTTR